MKSYFLALSLLCGVGVLSAVAHAQATVNENLETKYVYVDAVSGSDQNPGTQSQPYKTINKGLSAALSNNSSNLGTRVTVNPGTYRETLTITGPLAHTKPITIEAANNGTAIISGGVLYTGWAVYSGNSSIYTNSWTHNYGECAQVPGCSQYPQLNIMLRREMVAVNGAMLTQVMSLAQMLYPGTFYVDETGNTIYVWPPSGTDMSTASVDVATNPALLTINNASNLVFRGLVFQYANTCRSSPAVAVNNGSNVLFDTDTFQYNNGQGLAIYYPATYFTVENSSALNNGDSGFQSSQTKYGLWSNNLTEYNNWRGAQSAYYNCNVSGQHFWLIHDDQLENVTSAYNQSYGIHWDTDNKNITTSGLIVANNLLAGLFIEKNEGPISISASYICNHTSTQSLGGLQLSNSGYHGTLSPGNISLTNSFLYNNSPTQITVQGTAGGVWISDWETGKSYDLYDGNFTNTGNTIEGVGTAQTVFKDSYLNGTDWTNFWTTLVSNTNDWWNSSNSAGAFSVPVPVLGTDETFAAWQLSTLQDLLGSSFSQPSGSPFTPCTSLSGTADYWLTADNSSVTSDPSGTAVYNLTVTPLHGFNSKVSLALDGAAEVSGLTGTLSTTSVSGGSGTATLTVTDATTTTPGTYPVTVLANNGSDTHTVSMNLVVPSTSLRFSSVNLNFGNQQTKTTSPGLSFTITNFGTKSVKMTSYTASATVWAISGNTCPASSLSLGAGKSCTITVTFTPTAAQAYTGSITVVDGDANSPQVVNLTGTGTPAPQVVLSTYSLHYGDVLENTSSQLTVTLTNVGAGNLTISSNKVTGSQASMFTQTNNCPSPVLPNGECTYTVTFTPTNTSSDNATLTIYDNTSSGSHTVSLYGTGKLPKASFSPKPLDFGNVEVSYSSSLTETLSNSKDVLLTISSIQVTGSNTAEYSITSNLCGSSLDPGASCDVTVKFSPTASDSQNSNLTVYDNSSSGSDVLSLTGTGKYPSASLSPSSDYFGSVTVGKKSSAQTSTLTNTSSGNWVLNITKASISGSNSKDFSYTTTCGSSLNQNKSCTYLVTFTPSKKGTESATLTVTDNTSKGSNSISLNGTGK